MRVSDAWYGRMSLVEESCRKAGFVDSRSVSMKDSPGATIGEGPSGASHLEK
jgi:hypothetical protein